MLMGVGLIVLFGFYFGGLFSCVSSPATCANLATQLSNFGYGLTAFSLGQYLLLSGAILAGFGHLSEYLRPVEVEPEEKEQGLRICLKCGRQVEPSATFCSNCGNPLAKAPATG